LLLLPMLQVSIKVPPHQQYPRAVNVMMIQMPSGFAQHALQQQHCSKQRFEAILTALASMLKLSGVGSFVAVPSRSVSL
jgi:hypothetical protein